MDPRSDSPLARAAIRLPQQPASASRALLARLVTAIALVVLVTLVVYADRDGYQDAHSPDPITVLDAAYYAVVTLSTTGYGDITPVSAGARLVNILLITPARLLFLIILVGTTLEVLTDRYRTNIRLDRWRKRVKDHYVVCGYGTKGRSAVKALLENGVPRDRIVVVESAPAAAREASAAGLTVVEGSSTRAAILGQAEVTKAKAVIVSTNSDDAAVLTTLTARQLTSGQVRIVASAREGENAPLLKQSGAHQVVVSSETAGRLLGLSTMAPPVIDVVEDLLTPGAGMALAMRSAARDEVGRSPRDLDDVVIAIYRRGRLMQLREPDTHRLETGDQVIYVRDDRPPPDPTA